MNSAVWGPDYNHQSGPQTTESVVDFVEVGAQYFNCSRQAVKSCVAIPSRFDANVRGYARLKQSWDPE